MGKMSRIAWLCDKGDREQLIKELNMTDLTKLTGKTVEEVADGFIEAYNNIRLQKNNPAFGKLNEIQDEMLEYESTNLIQQRVDRENYKHGWKEKEGKDNDNNKKQSKKDVQ